MPLVARLTSPGRSDQLPPPTRETMEAWWCGARKGGRSSSSPSGRAQPAAEWIRVTVRASSGRERREQARPGARPAWSCPTRAARSSGGGGGPPRRPRRPAGPGPGPARRTGRAGSGRRSGCRRRRGGGPARLATQDGHQLAQRGRARERPPRAPVPPPGRRRAGRPRRAARRGVGQGDHARDVAERAVQPELPAEGRGPRCRPGSARRRRRAGRRRWGDRGRHHPCARPTGQVDRDAPQRPRQSARQDGGPDPVPRLAHGGVGQADDGESGQAVGDVDLDRDRRCRRLRSGLQRR